jgi:hypothetical protein
MRSLVVLAAIVGLLPVGSGADPLVVDTSLVETFSNASIELSPGLCAPGDTAECVGPQIAQFKVISDFCVMNGRFEGTDLPTNAPCRFELYGFQVGLNSASKPACGAARFYTSDETTAFGGPDGIRRENKLVINGVARSIFIEGYSLGAAVAFTTVDYDDADADQSPFGDHAVIAPPVPVQRSSSGSGTPCVSAPLNRAIMPGGASFHY